MIGRFTSICSKLAKFSRVSPAKNLWIEFWTHLCFAVLMFLVLFREGFSVDRLGLSAFAGSFVALVLMPGYQVCEEQTGEKIGVIQGWSVILRIIYLTSRAFSLLLYRVPWPGVARLGGNVIFTIAIFQLIQAIYLWVLLYNDPRKGDPKQGETK